MLKKYRGIIFFHVVFLGISLVMLFSCLGYVNYVKTHGYTYKMGDFSTKYDITLSRAKEWSEVSHGFVHGMQYDGVIYNNTDEVLSDWKVEIKFIKNCKVDSYWNGTVTYEDDVMTLKCLDYNKNVDPHNYQPFGFVLHANRLDNVEECSVTFYKPVYITDFWQFWCSVIGLFILVIVDITLLVVYIRNREMRARQKIAQDIITQSFTTFANIIDAKDPYTRGHSVRVAIYSQEIARKMGLTEQEQEHIFMVGSVHDIGKVGISNSILQKKGKLTGDEREEMKHHVDIGADMLRDFTAVKGIQSGAMYHHEWYDGSGYTRGIKGEDIPLFARIIGVADSFDAMSSDRCYRPRLDMDVIINELHRCSGTQFDPEVVKAVLELIEEGKIPVQLPNDPVFTADYT